MSSKKIFGVVEGFYGRYYSFYEHRDLIRFLSQINLNTFVYAPKSDPYHRDEYYKPYPHDQLKEFETLNNLARKHSIDFNYALSPGPKPDLKLIERKIKSMMKIGLRNFSLLYDDIKIGLNARNASIQAETANAVYKIIKQHYPEGSLFFCPTQYYGFERTDYILTIAEKLHPHIRIFWTGANVVSKEITEKDVERITQIIGRQPLIWDNYFANDYIPGIILRLPYQGREPGIVAKVSGILVNPMNQYLQSKPLIYTAGAFYKNPQQYNPENSLITAEIFLNKKTKKKFN
ncbi:MAG: beta-N-acetylglucosaminidase domain-containing protein [bacterium]